MIKKEKLIQELIEVADKIEVKYSFNKQKTEELQLMANLARMGLKESEEFKVLERKYKQPQVVDFGDVIKKVAEISQKLKKLKNLK
jgi:hypothetical protein